MKRSCFVSSILILIVTAATATARTWHVERDGSGDFWIIQLAVDAAASGDTIMVGPGSYPESFGCAEPQEFYRACIQLRQEELTIIGAGVDSTFIGVPGEGWDGWGGQTERVVGVFADDNWGNQRLTIQNLTVRNLRAGILSYRLEKTILVDCVFNGNRNGALISNGEFLVRNTWFGNQPSNGTHFIALSTPNSVILNCEFFDDDDVDPSSGHISIGWSLSSVAIMNSTFIGGVGGVVAGGDVRINNCLFRGLQYGAVGVAPHSSLIIEQCRVEDTARGVKSIESGSDVTITDTIFESISEATLIFSGLSNCRITDCNLAKGTRYVATTPQGLKLDDPPNVEAHVDMRNNWWGTSDPDSIQAWIHDAADDSTEVVVFDWFPYLDAPVADEKSTMSDLKHMFR